MRLARASKVNQCTPGSEAELPQAPQMRDLSGAAGVCGMLEEH